MLPQHIIIVNEPQYSRESIRDYLDIAMEVIYEAEQGRLDFAWPIPSIKVLENTQEAIKEASAEGWSDAILVFLCGTESDCGKLCQPYPMLRWVLLDIKRLPGRLVVECYTNVNPQYAKRLVFPW